MPNNKYPQFYVPWSMLRGTESNNKGWADILSNPPLKPKDINAVSTRRQRKDGKPALAIWDYIIARPPGPSFTTDSPTYKDMLLPRQDSNTWWHAYKHGLMYGDNRKILITGKTSLRGLAEEAHANVHRRKDVAPVDMNPRRTLCSYTQDYLNEIARLVVQDQLTIMLGADPQSLRVKAYGVVGTHFDEEGYVSIPAVDLFDTVTTVVVVAIVPGCGADKASSYLPETAVIVGHQDVSYIAEGAIFKPKHAGYIKLNKFRGNFHYRLAHKELLPFNDTDKVTTVKLREPVYTGPALPCRKCLIIDDTVVGHTAWPYGFPPKDFSTKPEWAERYNELTQELKDTRKARADKHRHVNNSRYNKELSAANEARRLKIRNNK